MNILKSYVDNIVNNGKGALTLSVENSKLKSNTITVNGYKHSMVQIICVAIAYNIKVKIVNAPKVIDTYVFCKLIKKLGGVAKFSKNTLNIDPSGINDFKIDSNLSKLIHGSLYLMPALLIRLGQFEFGGAGGCQIEANKSRQYNHILNVMKQFGANIKIENNIIKGEIYNFKEIKTIDILEYSTNSKFLEGSAVGGATKTAILLSLNQRGVDILNPYLKTDVLDMLRFLQESGHNVNMKENKISIGEKTKTNCKIVNFKLTQCISEIITYITFAVLNNINIKVKNLDRDRVELGLKPEFELLNKINVKTRWNKNNLIVEKDSSILPHNIEVLPETIQSDHHPFFAIMLTKAGGVSKIVENVYKFRFVYVENLKKLGFNLINENNTVIINPCKIMSVNNLSIEASDVRTGVVTLLGAIKTHSKINIKHGEHIFRGYDSIVKNLYKFGVKISIKEEKNENSFYC